MTSHFLSQSTFINFHQLSMELSGMTCVEVILSTPDRHIEKDKPLRLWLHLTRFEKAKLRKLHEPTLNSLNESDAVPNGPLELLE